MVDDLQAQVLHIFIQEGADLLEELDRSLLEIEEDPTSRELLAQFMRTAHTLKGSAGTVGLPAFSDTSHAIEDVVDALKRQVIPPSPRLFDQLSHAIDVLMHCLRVLAAGESEPDELREVETELRTLATDHDESKIPGARASQTKSDFPLGEYDHVRIGVARKRGMGLFRVELTIGSIESDPAGFAGDFVKLMRQHGDVISTAPQAAQFDSLQQTRRLLLLFSTLKSEAEITEEVCRDNASQIAFTAYADEAAADSSSSQGTLGLGVHDNTMRVEMEVLDELLRLVGELVINRSRLDTVASDFATELNDSEVASALSDAGSALGRIAGQFQGAIMEARLVPIGRLFRSVKRCIRDTSRWLGRSISLTNQGENTLIDQGLLESLRPPLLQLLQVLVVASTPEGLGVQTTMAISSKREGDNVYVQIDTDAGETDIRDLNPIVDEVRVLRGQLNVAPSSMGRSYIMVFPATQVILPAIITGVGDELYAFPMEVVQEMVPITSAPVYQITGARTTVLRGAPLPLVYLNELLDIPDAADTNDSFVVIVGSGRDATGVVVQKLIGKLVVVRKSLGRRFSGNHSLAGATILANGRIALILDIPYLLSVNARAGQARAAGVQFPAA